jgi:hypothetical protein
LFKSALLSAAELPLGQDERQREIHPPVQPVSVAYVGLHGLPMGRENRPFFAWYGDMELVPHLWEAFEMGPTDVVVELHKPMTVDEAGGRKQLAAAAEAAVRDGVVRALAGLHSGSAAPPGRGLLEALQDDEIDTEEAGLTVLGPSLPITQTADCKRNRMKLHIKTWHQMNVYDSARMADLLAPLGYAPVEMETSDMVIVNTCHPRKSDGRCTRTWPIEAVGTAPGGGGHRCSRSQAVWRRPRALKF